MLGGAPRTARTRGIWAHCAGGAGEIHALETRDLIADIVLGTTPRRNQGKPEFFPVDLPKHITQPDRMVIGIRLMGSVNMSDIIHLSETENVLISDSTLFTSPRLLHEIQ